MTLDQFRQALSQALGRHFPQSRVTMTESRGIVLTGRAELDADTFVAVYFNALTGKTSYGGRNFGLVYQGGGLYGTMSV